MDHGAPKPMRRNSAAGRAVAAATSQAALTLTPSPSPLLRTTESGVTAPPKIQRLTADAFTDAKPPSPTRIAALRKAVEDGKPQPVPQNALAPLPLDVLRIVASFCGANDVALATTFGKVCRAFYAASLSVVSHVTLVPDATSVDRIARTGAGSSLAQFVATEKRGQHITTLRAVNPRTVYAMSNSLPGPSLHFQDISRTVFCLPHLTHLDIRGVKWRSYTAWCDHFLVDLAASCPELQSLKCGSIFLTSWESQWWANLTALRELVIGSRREDGIWLDGPAVAAGAAVLPDDFLVMMRTLALSVVKLWCPLQTASFNQLIAPTAAFPHTAHLTINAEGNTHHKPNEDLAAKDEAKDATPAPKGKDKAAKAKQQDDTPAVPKVAYPALVSATVCDARERPEFVVELMAKFAVIAPTVVHWNVSNTHRNAPGKAPPPAAGKGRARAQ